MMNDAPNGHPGARAGGATELELVAEALRRAPCGAVVASTAASGDILFVNEEFTRLTGYAAEDVPTVASWLVQAYPDESYRAEVMGNWERDVSEPGRDVIYRVTCKDGGEREMLLRAGLLPDQVMVVTLLDVTEMRRVERDLRVSEARLRQITESLDHVFWTAGVDPLEMLYVSPAFERLWGLPVADVYRDPLAWLEPIVPEDKPRVLAALAACLDGRLDSWREELRIRWPGGEVRWLEDTGQVLRGEGGKPYRIIGVARDITARKRAEHEAHDQELRVLDARKMESLGVLAGGVAHEFNNLLMAVLGNAELVTLELPPEAKVRRRIEAIEKAARRAAELTDQLLAYAGKGRFVVEAVDLRAVVLDVMELLEASVSKKIRLGWELPPRVPRVEAAAGQMRQVVMHLVTNAAEAIGHAAGRIEVRVAAAEGLEEVALEVRDDGPGMDEATRARVFEPFFTTRFTGRGLGLAAVHGIVKAHGGRIEVWSAPGEGATFRATFPALVDEALALGAGADQVAEAPARPTILVVDDEPMVREVAAALLTRAGYEALAAASGEEAVALYEQHGPAAIGCVLLDVSMPGMDGIETLYALRALNPAVHCILASGHSEREVRGRCGDAPLAGYLQKPYDSGMLMAALERVLVG